MNARTILSAKGQVVIPKDVRDEMGLQPGQQMHVIRSGSSIVLRPVAAKSGRTFEEITEAIHARIRYDRPALSVEQMNDALRDAAITAATTRDKRARD